MPENSNLMNLPTGLKGTQIGEFQGGKIYTDGIQHGAVSISANLFGFSFGAEYDTITGGVNTPTSKSVSNGYLKLDVDNSGNVKTGFSGRIYEGGVVTYNDGTQGFYAGAGLKSKLGEFGISIDGSLPEHNTNLATYNSTYVFSDGTAIKTEYRTINNVKFESGIAAYITNYKYGKIVSTNIQPVDSSFAAQMSAGLKHCFAAGTLISMADGSQKAIELIFAGDLIKSYNEIVNFGRGEMSPKRVLRRFVNENQIVIDFHGTKVTPGHAYLCGDGHHEGSFRQIMNIIRDDGAVVLADGTRMRAATGCLLGSLGDAFVEIQIARPARHTETGEDVTLLKERSLVRAGTRVRKPDGSFYSFLELIEENGWKLLENGLVRQGPDHTPGPLLWAGASIPKPEDYILALSELTLSDLYDDQSSSDKPDAPMGRSFLQGEANAVALQAGATGRRGGRATLRTTLRTH